MNCKCGYENKFNDYSSFCTYCGERILIDIGKEVTDIFKEYDIKVDSFQSDIYYTIVKLDKPLLENIRAPVLIRLFCSCGLIDVTASQNQPTELYLASNDQINMLGNEWEVTPKFEIRAI